jgi:hypothetical protein
MKAIIHLSNGNTLILDEYETQQLKIQMDYPNPTQVQFSNESKTVIYTIDVRGIAYVEYTT